ncbi:IS200/IS605 family transposase [Gloeothece verrucosa]|uniref:Transposase IS200-family protein n=1 Tax=Gloeothece verrucosa (strain PCC 7822) TaxID=497965 RepID=E0UB07_GLOV7|nr:IS200/IS605 family transposase [Gloeothece verrucosa]ADN15129.1 transposase IS200-family protein [Gloeothece verrucosa PCC 7822]
MTTKDKKEEYRRNPHSVSLLNYHFVFCSKRRKPVLVGDVAKRFQDVIFGLCQENDWRLIALEIMSDHVHLFLNTDPTHAPSAIMKKVKGRSSHVLRKEFPELLKIPTLWTPSYFVSTAGNVSTETVKKYIETQRGK